MKVTKRPRNLLLAYIGIAKQTSCCTNDANQTVKCQNVKYLSILTSQYDPLGYIVLFTTQAKMKVQKLWDKRGEWDEPQLPEDLLDSWKHWESEL